MLQKMKMCAKKNPLWFVIWGLIVLGITPPQLIAGVQATPKLKIIVKAGDGATNNIKLRLSRELMVQVVDENDNPVGGATVLFALPESGAGGTFADAAKTLTVLTNNEGIATAQGFMPNEIAGKFAIQVNAENQGIAATASITQTNVIVGTAVATGAGMSGALLGAIIGGAAAAVIGGIIAAKGGDSNSQTETTRHGSVGVGSGPKIGPP